MRAAVYTIPLEQSKQTVDNERWSYKQLTPANWQDPDPTSEQFVMQSPVVGVRQLDGNDWARQILDVELGPQVPDDIRDVFGVARGCLLYGWFFYPLFRLGEEQVYRVAEMAARDRVEQIDGRRPVNFKGAIDRLVKLGEIKPFDEERWQALRELRNWSSHPTMATVMPPGRVLGTLKTVAHDVSRLFARPV